MSATELSMIDVAERVAREAAELVGAAYREMRAGGSVSVSTKSTDTDVVTAVDTESERLIRASLAALRPGDAVLGEEEGGSELSAASGSHPTGVTWVVDPIDGTVNFLYGHPSFAVSVGAQIGGVSVAGAVVEPVSGRCWTAARGDGAWLDGIRLRVNTPQRLELAMLATGFAYREDRRRRQAGMVNSMLGRIRDIRRGGSAALDLCAVAAGWVDAYCEHGLSPWDWAAGALIAEEAGAVVAVPGQDSALGADATFAAAPAIADDLRHALIESGAATV